MIPTKSKNQFSRFDVPSSFFYFIFLDLDKVNTRYRNVDVLRRGDEGFVIGARGRYMHLRDGEMSWRPVVLRGAVPVSCYPCKVVRIE